MKKTIRWKTMFRIIFTFIISSMILFGFNENLLSIEEKENSVIVFNARLGMAPGEFGYKVFKDSSWIEPTAIAIDLKGSIYIADPLNSRVQKFDKNGQYLSKIDMKIHAKDARIKITDLTNDKVDNLYVLSRQGRKIFIYDANGKLVNTIILEGKDLVWNDYNGWQNGYLESQRIAVDINGYIYVEAVSSLIKFDQKGNAVKKWSLHHHSNTSAFFLDPNGNLFLSKKINVWEMYNNNGNYLKEIDNANNPYPSFCPPPESSCQFPPKYVDAKGDYYYYYLDSKTSDLKAICRFNHEHRLINKFSISSVDIWHEPNMFKFDSMGNFYGYKLNPSKHEFSLLRFNLN